MAQTQKSTLDFIKNSSVKSMLNISANDHISEEAFKREYDQIISNISTSDIKNCLKSSKSEAKFYSEICNEELKKLKEEREQLEKQIKIETDITKRKDAEAAKIIKKLWEEANKSSPKGRKKGLAKNSKCLKPEDVRKVWQEAKKMSNQIKVKRRKLIAERNHLDAKIQLAKQAIQFCNKFGRSTTRACKV